LPAVRRLAAVALTLFVACGGDRRAGPSLARETASSAGARATDALVMRVPRNGGVPRVVAYPGIDSTIATASDPAPSIDRILGFDEDAGQVSFVDSRGLPGRIDFRLGNVSRATRTKLRELGSADGSTIYGIDPNGDVVRLTPDGDWSFKPPRPARMVFPVRDGTVLVVGGEKENAVLWRLRPPETTVIDSLELGPVSKPTATQTGDRVYLVLGEGVLVGIATRVLRKGAEIRLDHDIAALVGTPSGDRLYVATDSSRELAVIDRYRDRITAKIEFPGFPRDLRIDPLGRYLLVRAAKGDSVSVVAVGTDRVIGTVRSAWRGDLPFVTPDGAIALAQGPDVVFVDGETQRERSRVSGGASDFWFGFQWSGFRARSDVFDQPADTAARDSTGIPGAARGRVTSDSAARQAPPTIAVDTTPRGFVVSFAALLSEQRARELASQIHVRGQAARVVAAEREGTTIYRVVLGPYSTRDEAERVGKESGQTYWIYEGTP